MNWRQKNGECALNSLKIFTMRGDLGSLSSWVISQTIPNLHNLLEDQRQNPGKAPILAILLAPTGDTQYPNHVISQFEKQHIYLKGPDTATWDRFEVEMNHAAWPGRDIQKLLANGWLCGELEGPTFPPRQS